MEKHKIHCIMKNKKVLDINFSDEWRNKKYKIAHFALKRLYKRKKSTKKYLNIKNLQNTEQKISVTPSSSSFLIIWRESKGGDVISKQVHQ